MAQKQPQQYNDGRCCHVQPPAKPAFREEQRTPRDDHPIAYDEAAAGKEPDGGESLLSGAPREGEADTVDKASASKAFPQRRESGVDDKHPGDSPHLHSQ